MNSMYPIFTLKNECYDCYKCIRECTVKAIRIENGHASVMPEKCIACGHCVIVCPQKAKKVRNDIEHVKKLLREKKNIYVSLAPSWVATFDCNSEKIISALKKLGFKGVSETALGAQEISASTANFLKNSAKRFMISSACPVVVDYIRLYMSDYAKYITPIASPALTHAKILKQNYSKDSAVVFIGPCIAKKNEADLHPELIDRAITFKELQTWFLSEKINPKTIEIESDSDSKFVPEIAHEGSLYPLEGGMNETIKLHNLSQEIQLVNVSTIDSLKRYLTNLEPDNIQKTIFIEALACEGGCTNGPCVSTIKSGLSVISDVLSQTKYRDIDPSEPTVVVEEQFNPKPVIGKTFTASEIAMAMKTIGKYSQEDELDCDGCGYDTCRKLAEALLAKEAEPSMCVSYMRRITLRKTGAMLRCMPSGVVMTDNNFKIIENNNAFAKMFASEIYDYYSTKKEGLSGAALEKLIPCIDIFRKALKTGKDVRCDRYPIKNKLYDITAFTIEEGLIIGAIITDVTQTEMKREQIAKKAHDVISKNISTVQTIACLLGEHMAETELLLNSIAEGYESES